MFGQDPDGQGDQISQTRAVYSWTQSLKESAGMRFGELTVQKTLKHLSQGEIFSAEPYVFDLSLIHI